VHIVQMVSNLLGDGWVSRHIRVTLLRATGAKLGPGTMFHGGTYFSAPRRLSSGRNCFVNRNCYFDLGGQVVLGDDVVIGHGSSVITTEHSTANPARRAGRPSSQTVTVGDGAWLCANVTVLPGVAIGSGAVIGAGAVVTSDVPANALAAGVPARIVRMLDDSDGLGVRGRRETATRVAGRESSGDNATIRPPL
ncbi:MAG: hypothetical protein M3N98_10855, partial [Actinomycetota bacterium]|nr:hypothetical protein [Actinomycetota bacterium]